MGHLPTDDPQLLVGPALGEDAAVIDWDINANELLVAKSDPITFATDAIGYYAVNVCANDLAVTGARPLYYLPTILLPAGDADVALAEEIFKQIGDACRELHIIVAGGHSEITSTVSQPVIAGSMLGAVGRDSIVSTGGARPGDQILMAGEAPIEGASIIAREMRQSLLDRGWSSREVDEAADYLYRPGISVLLPARLAVQTGGVTSMHDPTEGGIATGLLEVATAARVGIAVDLDRIPISNLARRLCAEFGLDPLGTIASGSLLATAAADDAPQILDTWRSHGWSGTVIGTVVPLESDIRGYSQGMETTFPRFTTDEITKLWT